MTRSRLAALFALAFLVFFAIGGITANTTLKEVTVETALSMPKLLLSISSASILLLPIALCAMVVAVIALLGKQRNVGMLFAGVAFVAFAVFMIAFSREECNLALYNRLSDLLKEAGVKFKKRDFGAINVTYSWSVYAALIAAAAALITAVPSGRKDRYARTLKRDLLPYAYIAPHILLFCVFFITPALYGIYVAFTKWDLFNEPVFTGLSNFKTLLFDTENTYYRQLRNGLGNTFKFVLYSVPFCIILPLSLACALHTRCKGNKFFQAMYYLPSLLSITTVTLTWRYFFNADYGVMNKLFMSTARWFTPPYSWVMLVVVTVWWCTGGTMVIYQSALASIPQDQYEAAAVDGAGTLQKFWNVTLPNMRYPLMYTLITTVIAQFNIFGQPDILLGFTNQEANAVLLQYIYENSVKKQVAGMSAAMAVILGLCIMVISIIQMRVMVKNNQ